MLEFARTMMGKVFFEGTLPKIAKALDKIGTELARLNDNLEAARAAEEKKG